MDTFFNIFRKVVIGMVFVIFGTTMLYVPQYYGDVRTVPVAEAGPGFVFDPVNWIENAGSLIVETATNIFSSTLNVKEFTLDGIAWAVAKMFMSKMVSSLIDWINSGFAGSPAFVQNLGDFMLQTADEEFGRAIQEVAPFICSPFRLNVQIAVALKYDQVREKKPPTCTLTGVFDNFEAFIDGEFKEGAWKDWFKLTSEPSVYTEYGATLSIDDGVGARVINAKGEQYSILDFGKGFFSGETCTTVTTNDGKQVEECVISKPGETISASLSKALGAGQDTLVTADEISEIVAALLGQLASTAFNGAAGLLGLSGGTGHTYRGYTRGSFAEELRSGVDATQTGGVNTATSTPREGGNTGDITFASGYIVDSLKQQETSLSRINSYIPRLQAFSANTLNTQQNRLTADFFLNEATTLRTSIQNEIALAGPIVQKYIDLDKEYNAPTTTVERRIEIRGLQSEVVQEFNAVGLTDSRTIEAVFTRWDSLLAQNVGPVIPACIAGWYDLDGDGAALEYDADCDGIEDPFRIDVGIISG